MEILKFFMTDNIFKHLIRAEQNINQLIQLVGNIHILENQHMQLMHYLKVLFKILECMKDRFQMKKFLVYPIFNHVLIYTIIFNLIYIFY